MRINILTGFRDDQKYSVDSEEAHKAYFLFLNPEKRGVFSNGLAVLGADIRRIEPDWQGTMGWAPTHKLTDDDWAKIRKEGMKNSLDEVMTKAKNVAQELIASENFALLAAPLSQIAAPQLPEYSKDVKLLADKFKA